MFKHQFKWFLVYYTNLLIHSTKKLYFHIKKMNFELSCNVRNERNRFQRQCKTPKPLWSNQIALQWFNMATHMTTKQSQMSTNHVTFPSTSTAYGHCKRYYTPSTNPQSDNPIKIRPFVTIHKKRHNFKNPFYGYSLSKQREFICKKRTTTNQS